MRLHSGLRAVARLLCVTTVCMGLSGCVHTNARQFHAEELPDNLRYSSRKNPLEASLTRLASVPPSGNAIAAGDFLQVDIVAGLERTLVLPTLNVRVGEDGMITLPDLGPIQVVGLTPDAAGTAIRSAFLENDLYRNPLATVRIAEKRTNTVRVVGGVRNEGAYELPVDRSDVLTAITEAGGLADDAGWKVEVLTARPNRQAAMPVASASGDEIDLAAFASEMPPAGGPLEPITISLTDIRADGGYALSDGAVVMVEKRDPKPINVRGLVNKPGPIEPDGNDIRVLDALAQAGDVKNQFANKIVVIRPTTSGNPIIIKLTLNEAKRSERSNILLAPGDTVSVDQTWATLLMDALRIIRFGVSSNLTQFL